MILFYIFILIPVIASVPNEVPSYRSSVMEGDKPILRMAAEPPGSDYESDDVDLEPEVIHTTDNGDMVRDVGLLIRWLVENFGYDVVPQGRRNKGTGYELNDEEFGKLPIEVQEEVRKIKEAVEELNELEENEKEVVEDDKVEKVDETAREDAEDVADEESPMKTPVEAAWQAADAAIDEVAQVLMDEQSENAPVDEPRQVRAKPLKEAAKKIGRTREKKRKSAKRKRKLRHSKKNNATSDAPRNTDPNWMPDLKDFMKDLISRIGQKDLEKYTKPVILSLEKKHNALITDIDVNKHGEILVNYINRSGKKAAAAPKSLWYNPTIAER